MSTAPAPARWAARQAGLAWGVLSRTLRLRGVSADGAGVDLRGCPTADRIFAVREGDLLSLAALVRLAPFTTLVSPGRDGDLAAAAAERLGVRVVRGSSLHEGTRALLQLVRALRGSADPLVMVVDGPLGPAGVAKAGVIACAALLGRPVVPVATAARPRLVFTRAWSRLHLPLPGARVALALGVPLAVDRRPGPAGVEALRADLTRRLAAAAGRAEAALTAGALGTALPEGTR